MRILGRSESPSFPLLETLLPMEKSWALEVEKEEETSCLQGKTEGSDRGTERVNQIESSWVSCKRLNSGSKEASHRRRERENEFCSKRASRSFDSKPSRNDQHNDSSRHSKETRMACQFTSSSRCYPPSVHIRSSEFSVSAEGRVAQLRSQRDLHETTNFAKPNKTSVSFDGRQHLIRSKNGFSRDSQGVKPSENTFERRQDHFECLNHRAEMTPVYEASKKHRGHVGYLSRIQDHEELDECMPKFQLSFDEHSQYRHRISQYPMESVFAEHRDRYRHVKKMGRQGPCHGVTDWKNSKKGGRSIKSEMKQHTEAVLSMQSFEEKPGITNDEDVTSEALTIAENALPEGTGILESSCSEESKVKNNDSIIAKKCGRSIKPEMKQHNEAVLTVQSFEKKPGIANDEDVASEALTTIENSFPGGIGMYESSCTEESEVKNDDSVIAKKQYEMLASLLFDDLQDEDEDFDVMLVGEGPYCEYSGSIFDDELEAKMDIDVVIEDKEAMPRKVPEEYISKLPDCDSGKSSAVKSSASQHAKKSHNAYTSSGLKQSPSVLVDVTNKFEIHSFSGAKGEVQEDDAHRLSQRQRQIEFGKNTLGYERYSELIPRIKRKAKDPQTPNPKQVCSKRSWDGQIRKWRRLLHVYDPPSEDGEEIAEDFSILKLHRSNLEEKGPDAKEKTSPTLRFAESSESRGCIAVVDRKNVGDANLTIYDDWMES